MAVLTVGAVTRTALLADETPDLASQLTEADDKVLEAAGWTPSSGLRALLNFSGAALLGNTHYGLCISDPCVAVFACCSLKQLHVSKPLCHPPNRIADRGWIGSLPMPS